MYKYQIVRRLHEKPEENESRITKNTLMVNYLQYIAKTLKENGKQPIIIKGMGNVISKAISLSMVCLKRIL